MTMPLRSTLLLLLLLAMPWPALASDGVLEINHTCATTTGCFSGDSAGYPVTIDGAAGRSYVLTSDLQLPTDTDGIQLTTSYTVIDLNGFSIIRDCMFANTSGGNFICIRGTSGEGVRTVGNHERNEVRNGSIGFVGGTGVDLDAYSAVRNVKVSRVGGIGIQAGTGSVIEGCVVEDPYSTGIAARGVIRNNTVVDAGVYGIDADAISTVTGNVVQGSSSHGIAVEYGTVRGNTSRSNGGHGILAVNGSVVENVSADNTLDGIRCDGCIATGNHLDSNGNAGIATFTSGGYGGNTISGAGTVAGAMIQTDLNVCNGNTTCP